MRVLQFGAAGFCAWRRGRVGQRLLLLWGLSSLAACAQVPGPALPTPPATSAACRPESTVRAEIVALEQAYVLNRFGAYVPAGMMYALKRDVVALDSKLGGPGPGNAKLRADKRPRPLVLRVHEGGCLQVTLHNWMSPSWEEEGGQPPEPTLPLGDRRVPAAPAHLVDPPGSPTSRALKRLTKSERDAPRTRSASFFVTGLEVDRPQTCPVGAICGGDGTYVGLAGQQGTFFDPATPETVQRSYRSGSVVQPGQTSVTTWVARREGTFFAHSMGAPVGGEGDGGQIGLGLFAAVNVEPPQSHWYRSQVTQAALDGAAPAARGGDKHPYASVDYERLSILEGNEIVHSDLNAIIVRSQEQRRQCELRLKGSLADGQRCEPAFREFTVVLHDEVHAVQAFPELEDPDNPLHYVKDGMGINYGVSSMGSTAYAAKPQRGVGPAAQCPECRAEEFFLSSWANGDPALVLKWDAAGKRPVGALYPDDPSNVHHSYLGDPVVFRNLHAGPKETHVFHLHAHQWVLDASDPNSTYLDSQTISPGATFSYGIEFGGSGNRNFTVGDSIFHCHLYPHFAQGMWELWRVHDVFENGLHRGVFDAKKTVGPGNDPRSRSLPDGEVAEGIASPALVPLPGIALAPMPSLAFRGYPFFIPGEPGHRPPQPVLDMDVDDRSYADFTREPADPARIVNGGLPRHVVKSGELSALNRLSPASAAYRKVLDNALAKGGDAAQVIARKVAREFPLAFQAMAGEWETLEIKTLPHSGTVDEKAAMSFHEGGLTNNAPLADGGLFPVAVADVQQPRPDWWTLSGSYRTAFAATAPGMEASQGEPLFRVNGRGRAPGAPFANPCPPNAPLRQYRAAFIQTEMTVNRHGWFDPQGRMIVLEDDLKDVIDANRRTKLPEPLFFRANSGDCINFKSSNFVPSALNADDFQVYTPTDTIGQHIHLVKFDVTSSDGSGNGFNYEDGAFSADEVRERIFANNRTPGAAPLAPKAHPLFAPGGSVHALRGDPYFTPLARKGECPPQGRLSDHAYEDLLRRDHPFCGAQRTTQRWWADPILVRSGPNKGKDNTLRTVFTHDHFGPSSHQQHGLYAALVIEPANSVWRAELPADPAARIALKKTCGAANDDAIALQASVPAGAMDPLDRGIAAAFAVRKTLADPGRAAQLGDTALRQRTDACLSAALLGGSDLAAASVNTTGRGDAQIAPVAPRPVLRRADRTDGGPTATRATIVSPTCLNAPDSNPYTAGPETPCRDGEAAQTRREFALAFADFAGVYNLAFEPINPETPRDVSMRRFGERQVAARPARPLIISSEDPGTQLVNYRNEPLALRIADMRWNPQLGGFDYQQSGKRSDGKTACAAGDRDCLGDMANGMASEVHAQRDRELASTSYLQWLKSQGSVPASAQLVDLVSPALRSHFQGASQQKLKAALEQAEQWRQDFNCALYTGDQWRPALVAADSPFPNAPKQPRFVSERQSGFIDFCASRVAGHRRAVAVAESSRVFGDPATPILATHEGDPVQIRLIQGSQEAQHVFTMNGLKWHRMPDSNNSGFTNAQPIGISEHFEFDIRVPEIKQPHADYLYFGSSVDQMWDGMWGVLRAICDPKRQGKACYNPEWARTPELMDRPADRIARVPGAQPTPRAVASNDQAQIAACTSGRDANQPFEVKSFDVSVTRACELLGNCGKAMSGTVYSRRHGIHDPNALVYVLGKESKTCSRTAGNLTSRGCFDDTEPGQLPPVDNQTALSGLKEDFLGGRRSIEPLVLRAAAGQCVTVMLRNHLKPDAPGQALSRPLQEFEAFHNFLPMITDGFNLNQFTMSSSVGLSAPRVAQNPLLADGSNVGLNGAVKSIFIAGDRFTEPGSLVPACKDGERDAICTRDYVWSATDLQVDASGATSRPVEFGGLPLRSFGDVVKHPVHGLVGALVIGPEGSQVCADASRAFPGGTSRAVCDASGRRLYGDHVLVMQDAVSAVQEGFPVPDLKGAEEPDDYGVKAINYKTEPLWARNGGSPSNPFEVRNTEFDFTAVFSSKKEGAGCEAGMPPNGNGPLACDPETPVIEAVAGEALRLHFVHPGGHTRQQGLTVSGHGFNPFPWSADSRTFAPERCDDTQAPLPSGCLLWQGVYNGFGPMMGATLAMRAGGTAAVPKDYLLRTQASFLLDGGLWGILRVRPAGTAQADNTTQ